MSLTLRRTNNSPLTNDELDDNFTTLNSGIINLAEDVDALDVRITANTNEIINVKSDISELTTQTNTLTDAGEVLRIKDLYLDRDIEDINTSLNDIRNEVYAVSSLTNKLAVSPFFGDETIIIEKSGHTPPEITIKASDLLLQTTKSQTLTNKIISGASNTFVNVPATSLQGKVSLVNGGTNSTSAEQARTNLGLEIGKDVQGYNAQTVIGTNANIFTNVNHFNHNGFFLSNLSATNPKTVSFRLANSVGASNHVLTIPEKDGTLATLDDIVVNGVLRYEDVGVRVLAHDSYVSYKNRDNYFEDGVTQNFSNNFLVIRDTNRANTTAKFIMGSVPQNSSISIGVPPESGVLATREYVENRFGAQVVSSFTTPGYYIMPGGLILQWGSLLINQTQHSCTYNPTLNVSHKHSTTAGEIIFPMVFPHACFTVTATPRDSSPSYIDGCEMAIGIIKKQNEKFNFLVNRVSGCTPNGEVSMYVDFIAIGW